MHRRETLRLLVGIVEATPGRAGMNSTITPSGSKTEASLEAPLARVRRLQTRAGFFDGSAHFADTTRPFFACP